MKTEEIIEGNKLIAEFMGYYPIKGDSLNPEWWWTNENRDTRTFSLDMKIGDNGFHYHTSWDWLMPVVEKIQKEHRMKGSLCEKQNDYYGDCIYVRYFNNWRCFHYWNTEELSKELNKENQEAAKYGETITDHSRIVCKSKIEATYKAVVQFITWHNNQKKEKGK